MSRANECGTTVTKRKKNCFNCIHFEKNSDEWDICPEFEDFDGSICHKRPEETEDVIHLQSYQEKAKRCCELIPD